jgi:hypothetical protein
MHHQSLAGLVVSDAEIDKEDHVQSSAIAIGRGLNHLMPELTFELD